jgi:hypothetical protein
MMLVARVAVVDSGALRRDGNEVAASSGFVARGPNVIMGA